MKILKYSITHRFLFEQQLLFYFKNKKNIVFLNSNAAEKTNLLAVADNDNKAKNDWQFGFITYDYKNKIEQLTANNFDGIRFPEKHFFTPELLFKIKEEEVDVLYQTEVYTQQKIENMLAEIENVAVIQQKHRKIKAAPRVTKLNYLQNVKTLKKHIQLGNIYEINYCQEFFAEQVKITPIELYFKLNKKSPMPFSCFVKYDDKFLMCASPERFIKKEKDKIISKPIKGTIKRGDTPKEDEQLKNQLFTDKKERAENIMIVDLVRNDLAKIAQKSSVKVDELCGIYSFPQVHQMISTVSAKLNKEVDFNTILKATFPMGSMTGAPKIRAMELIEQYETTKRGLYAGSVGYIAPNGNFDFNVVIRSILYNTQNNYLSFMVGGAITHLSNPEKEYEECLLKAKAILEVLNFEL